MLRQLMRQARQRIAKGGSVIRTSVSTFMELLVIIRMLFDYCYVNALAHLLNFVPLVAREIQHFIAELADYLEQRK